MLIFYTVLKINSINYKGREMVPFAKEGLFSCNLLGDG